MSWLAYPLSALLIVVATALENTWPGWLLLLGRRPDVALATVVAVALGGGPVLGCFAGLVAALLAGSTQSLMFGSLFLAYMGVGTLVGLLRGTLIADRVVVAMLVLAVAGPLKDITLMLFAPPQSPSPWLLGMLVAAPYSAAVAAPVYALTRLLLDRVSLER
ncbi:MAG TPA: hypothetical protein VM283_04405 [Armatimonadota bacterium]|nr:hypothetical protein [Armatimonadota bacterium]